MFKVSQAGDTSLYAIVQMDEAVFCRAMCTEWWYSTTVTTTMMMMITSSIMLDRNTLLSELMCFPTKLYNIKSHLDTENTVCYQEFCVIRLHVNKLRLYYL